MLPAKKSYYISQQNKRLLDFGMKLRSRHPVNFLIAGRHGLGKSELAKQMALHYGCSDYVAVSVGLLQQAGQLMGHNELGVDEKTGVQVTKFVPSQFIRACVTPNCLIHLEELNRPESPKALNELFPLLDDSRSIDHDKVGHIQVASGVVFVATLNEGFEYTGTDPLDDALRDRFMRIELDYLPRDQEAQMLMVRTGLPLKMGEILLDFINGLRGNTQDPLHVSTRKVITIAELIQEGMDMREAILDTIATDKQKMEKILMGFDFKGQSPGSNNFTPKAVAGAVAAQGWTTL